MFFCDQLLNKWFLNTCITLEALDGLHELEHVTSSILMTLRILKIFAISKVLATFKIWPYAHGQAIGQDAPLSLAR